MRRGLLIGLLGLGTLVGFASGFHHVRHHHRYGPGAHAFGYGPASALPPLDALAEACVRAAEDHAGRSPAPRARP